MSGTPCRSDQGSIRPGSAADFRCASTTRCARDPSGKNGGATSLIARTHARHSHARRNASTHARARATAEGDNDGARRCGYNTRDCVGD